MAPVLEEVFSNQAHQMNIPEIYKHKTHKYDPWIGHSAHNRLVSSFLHNSIICDEYPTRESLYESEYHNVYPYVPSKSSDISQDLHDADILCTDSEIDADSDNREYPVWPLREDISEMWTQDEYTYREYSIEFSVQWEYLEYLESKYLDEIHENISDHNPIQE
jgi:hypothetical protein